MNYKVQFRYCCIYTQLLIIQYLLVVIINIKILVSWTYIQQLGEFYVRTYVSWQILCKIERLLLFKKFQKLLNGIHFFFSKWCSNYKVIIFKNSSSTYTYLHKTNFEKNLKLLDTSTKNKLVVYLNRNENFSQEHSVKKMKAINI